MQYNQETEKVAMMNSSYMTVPKPLSLTEDHEVQRTRKILIIILGVFLVSCFDYYCMMRRKKIFVFSFGSKPLPTSSWKKNLPLLDVIHIELLGSFCASFGCCGVWT
jgi:hypothetical protein